jgi:hypothetical protein
VDEAACAGQLHRLRHVRAGGHGGVCLPDQAAGQETKWYKLAPLWLLGVVLCFEPIVFRQGQAGGSYWMVYFGISALIVAGILRPASALPPACPLSRCWTT